MLAKRGNETTAVAQKKYNKNIETLLAKQIFSLFIWPRPLKVMLQHPTVWFDWKQSKYPSKELLLYDFLQGVDRCIKDCDKERLQTTAFINVWKIFPGYTGDWFDVKTASTCTTELWDALKSFILDSLKIKVAPHPIIVSLDTLIIIFPLEPPEKAWHREPGAQKSNIFCAKDSIHTVGNKRDHNKAILKIWISDKLRFYFFKQKRKNVRNGIHCTRVSGEKKCRKWAKCCMYLTMEQLYHQLSVCLSIQALKCLLMIV